VPTRSGTTGRKIGRFRLPVWIAAPTESLATCRGLMFSYGIQPLLEEREDVDWTGFVRTWVREHHLSGAAALLVRGPSHRNPLANHSLEIVDLDPED
jgi:pyruvate kinase